MVYEMLDPRFFCGIIAISHKFIEELLFHNFDVRQLNAHKKKQV